jgi:phenylpyruvate C(3)-methyltransferase
MTGTVTTGTRRLYNSAVIAYAVSAAMELGLLEKLRVHDKVDVVAFAEEHGLDAGILRGLAETLVAGAVVTYDRDSGHLGRGGEFDGVDYASPFFYWLTRGSGRLLSRLPDYAVGRTPPTQPDEDPWGRDMRAVAVSARVGAERYFNRILLSELGDVDFTTVADLGCGGGDRLVTLLNTRDGARGVGVDISAPALDLARENTDRADMRDRIDLFHDDVTSMRVRPEFAEVDLLTCFLMGHDFWPHANAVRTMRMLRTAFPNVRHFVLCDECQVPDPFTLDSTIFTMGFMLAHAAMRKYIPTVDEWYSVFEESGWECRATVRSGLPESNVVFHLTPSS